MQLALDFSSKFIGLQEVIKKIVTQRVKLEGINDGMRLADSGEAVRVAVIHRLGSCEAGKPGCLVAGK